MSCCNMFDWFKVTYEPSSVSVSPRGHVAVGGAMDNKVHLYELKGTDLAPLQELDHLGAVTDVAYSPDDNYLVACDAHRKVVLYSVPEYKVSGECFVDSNDLSMFKQFYHRKMSIDLFDGKTSSSCRPRDQSVFSSLV
jgi:WD40 repeat protein